MDIIGKLPLEISQYILDWLPVEDLGRCLAVSKKWREITNCDFLWKKHCMKYELAEGVTSKEPLGLCSWASAWKCFGRLPTYNWHLNKYEELTIPAEDKNYILFAFHKDEFVAYSWSNNCLDVYSVLKGRNNANKSNKIKLVCSMPLCFPANTWHVISLCMSEKYVVAVKFNIILVFQKTVKGDFEMYKAINVDFPHQFVTKNIEQFVEEHTIENYFVEPYDIRGRYLWFTVPRGIIASVLDVVNDRINNVVVNNAGTLFNNFFVTWSPANLGAEGVRVYDKKGDMVVFLDDIGQIEDITVNEKLVCIQGRNLNDEVNTSAWEISSGECIFSKSVIGDIRIKLNPNEDVLYLFETLLLAPLYLISAWDVRKSVKLWVYEDRYSPIKSEFFILHRASWNLEFVCGAYLISWPLMNSKDKFVCLDSKTGKLLYEGNTPHSSAIYTHIFDTVWISIHHEIEGIIVRAYN